MFNTDPRNLTKKVTIDMLHDAEYNSKRVNHYKWLEKHLPAFFEKVGISFDNHAGIIGAHGDKCYGYRDIFEVHGIEFPHGVAIFLLSYCSPYSKEVRAVEGIGWVPVEDWIVANKDRFLLMLPPIDATDEEVLS